MSIPGTMMGTPSTGTRSAQAQVTQMTLGEKVNMTRGTEMPLCSGNLKGVPRLNIPDICFLDGASGLHIGYLQTQYPNETCVGATWNKDLAEKRASAMGQELRAAGVHNALSVVAGPLGYTPYGGRNWENFSPDPFLTGRMTGVTVKGLQKNGVNAVAKHFVGNEQEYLRSGTPFQPNVAGPQDDIINGNVPDDVLHETLILPFAEAIRSGLGGIMCSFNRVNSVLARDSPDLKQVLREELGYLGFQVSDWGAAQNAFPSTNAGGTDINMPGGGIPVPGLDPWGNGVLEQGVLNGTVTEARLNEQVIRALTPYFALAQDEADFPSANLSRVVFAPNASDVAYQVAKEGITLVKNVGKGRGLPLVSPRSLGLFGDASVDPVGNFHFVGLDGPANAQPAGYRTSGGGASLALPPWISTPLEAFTQRARQDKFYLDHYLSMDPTEGAQSAAFGPELLYPIDGVLTRVESALVFVTAYSSEGFDRQNLTVDRQGDELVQYSYVASKCDNTIVVINSAGPVDISAWADHDNVTAIVFHYFPGQEGGRALVPIVFGDESPSGKLRGYIIADGPSQADLNSPCCIPLAFTVAKVSSDYDSAAYFTGNASLTTPTVNLTNLIDYRHFDYYNITPRYEFGLGLTYSTFELTDFDVEVYGAGAEATLANTNEVLLDNDAGLYDQAYKASVSVKNTGSIAAWQVVQLYVSYPESGINLRPLRVLRGFDKVYVEAGHSMTIELPLVNKDLAVWDTQRNGWMIKQGDYQVSLGFSSRDLPVQASLTR